MNENGIKIDLSVTDETDEKPKKNKQARDWCFTINKPRTNGTRVFRLSENSIRFAVCSLSA